MRRQLKSIVSMVLSAAMVIALGSGLQINTKSADAFGYDLTDDEQITMTLRQNNSKVFETDPDANPNGDLVSVAVTRSGVYTLTAEAADDVEDVVNEAQYIGVETGLVNISDTLTIKGKTVSVKHFEADGGATVKHYDWNATLYHNGNTDKGQLRLGVTNHYVNAPNGKGAEEFGLANPFKTNVNGTWTATEAIDVQKGDLVSFTFEVSTTNEPADWEQEHPYAYVTPDALIGKEGVKKTPAPATPAPPTPTPNLNATSYNAYLGFQTDNYLFRDTWYNTGSNKYYNHKTQICISEAGKGRGVNANITNAVLKENTTYTISISGVNLKTLKSNDKNSKTATQFNMLYVDTDIPLTMKNVVAKNATLKIDGKVMKQNMTLPCKPDADGYYQLMIADAYSEDDGIKNCPYPKEAILKTLPTSSIEVSFTLSGVNFKQDFSTKTIGPKKGQTFTKGNFKYKVTKVSTSTAGKVKAGKVSVVGLSKAGKKAKKLTVGATVKKTGTYKIAALGSKAFKGAKATSVTLGKNVKKLPANAFANCKKLSKLTLKAKLSSVNKKAFSGCTKTITVSGTSKKANLKKIQKVYKKAK